MFYIWHSFYTVYTVLDIRIRYTNRQDITTEEVTINARIERYNYIIVNEPCLVLQMTMR